MKKTAAMILALGLAVAGMTGCYGNQETETQAVTTQTSGDTAPQIRLQMHQQTAKKQARKQKQKVLSP